LHLPADRRLVSRTRCTVQLHLLAPVI
jgi:hypothetical protein